jgi:hypothetical protein
MTTEYHNIEIANNRVSQKNIILGILLSGNSFIPNDDLTSF